MQQHMEHAVSHLRAADPVLAAVIDAVGPYELIPSAQGFRALANAIISQQISIKAAAAIMARLDALLGEIVPERLLAVTPEELRAIGLSGQKARYLRDLAERAALGALDLAALPALDDDTVIAQLTAVKGIGRWTAEIYLMFALGRPDVLPADDLGLRYAAQQFYLLPAPPPSAELRRIGEAWRPYRSVASWYLWRGRRML
jgi:DNA-3-methyladenine glycosylase II